MNKYIYAISNVYNGKMYIGQTKNIEGRWHKHKSDLKNRKHHSKSLQDDWDKYGEEGFEFIIFGDFENYNEMEIKLIKEFNTINQGYNSQEGGENPPILKDEDNFNCTHSNEIIDRIIYDLKYSDLSFLEIAKKYGYKDSTNIGRINNGKIRRREHMKYPIREKDCIYEEIKKLLKTTDFSQKEIANLLGVARSTVTMINIGKNHFDENENYPIRK